MRHAAYTLAVISTLLLPRFGLALEANEVFRHADPSVVVIVAEWEKRSEDRLVSGVLVEPLEIVTNCRSVDGAVKLVVKQGSVQRTAKLRYQDAARDLCQIRLDDAFPSGKPVSSYVYSKDLEVGQPVFAIGSPRGLEHTISRGIVSALREMKEEAGNLVQTDAAISPGSSGGGLFDSEGRLVGIITFGFKDAQNLNFALPSEWVQDLPKRNRDRLANIDAAKSAGGAAKPESESPDAAASGLPRVGDRWKYKLIDGKQTVGTVVVEITDVRGKTVTERITREGQKGFLAERRRKRGRRIQSPEIRGRGDIARRVSAHRDRPLCAAWAGHEGRPKMAGIASNGDAAVVRQEEIHDGRAGCRPGKGTGARRCLRYDARAGHGRGEFRDVHRQDQLKLLV